jgi:TusA-related sulfurtransferase
MEQKMPDIVGPVGMLKCMAALRQLPIGDSLSVTVRDADVYAALVKILSKDDGCRIALEATLEGHRLMVTKT